MIQHIGLGKCKNCEADLTGYFSSQVQLKDCHFQLEYIHLAQ